MLKHLQDVGVRHIAMEDLCGNFGKSYVKTQDNLNYNRLIDAVKLSYIKDLVKSIAVNYDIAVSFVHSSYTSKMCPICGCIHDNNRKSQEEFCCVSCGYIENADLNAAINIKNRIVLTVLCNKLLTNSKKEDGTFVPKKLKRENIKEILSDFYSSSSHS